MIQELFIYHGTGTDPYENLAAEKQLLDRVRPGQCILYLWQNRNTVVIGRNQNAWAECRTALLEQEGVKLARRLSGGGAVFHDLGNLNFTFCVCREDYDLDRQLAVIQAACTLAGISVAVSGRNDLVADGRKFSGNAFYQDKFHAYHHGTLMVDVDTDRLGRYLSPSPAKLQAKGVASVRSRVVNLRELAPQLTVEKLKEYMQTAFSQVYGLSPAPVQLQQAELEQIRKTAREYAAWEYVYGTPLPFTFSCDGRFDWGGVQIGIQAKNGLIKDCQVFSDGMDWQLPDKIRQALIGVRFDRQQITAALLPLPYGTDLCQLFNDGIL